MLENKNLKMLNFLVLIGLIATFSIFLLAREIVLAGDFFDKIDTELETLPIAQETTFLASAPAFYQPYTIRKVKVVVTAYSSSVWETQGDPFITASGSRVRDGIVANNLLSFGTKIRLPEIFGSRIFVVEDRMHSKKGYYHVDIWFPSREQALAFGSKLVEMEVLTN